MSEPLTFTAIEGESYVSIKGYNSPKYKIFKYSINQGEFKYYNVGEKILLHLEDKVSFRSDSQFCSTDRDNYFRFFTEGEGKLALSGSVNSLINDSLDLTEYCFYKLFHNCQNIVDASQLELPSNHVLKGSYQSMFENCFSLEKAPQLPAMILDPNSYFGMFRQCIALTQAPSELPATELSDKCYGWMFEKCLALTTSPVIKATHPSQKSCALMFYWCSNLTTITVNFTDWNVKYMPTDIWVQCIALNGTFRMPAQLEVIRGTSFIPQLWSIQTLEEG